MTLLEKSLRYWFIHSSDIYDHVDHVICVLNLGKNIDLVQTQLIFHSELFLIWSYLPDQPKPHTVSLVRLVWSWPRLIKPNQNSYLQSFPSMVTNFMQKILVIDWLARYDDGQRILLCDWTGDYFGLLIEIPCKKYTFASLEINWSFIMNYF